VYQDLYTLMFVLPLVVILVVAYRGMTGQKLARLAARNAALAKMLLSLFFFGIGAFFLVPEIRCLLR